MGIFKGGVPTEMEVTTLMRSFEIAGGISISCGDIEKAIHVPLGSNRFRTIVSRWRKRVQREKLIQSRSYGGAVHFLTADEAHDHSKDGLARVGRATGRLCVKVEMIDTEELSEERRERHQLLKRETHALLETARTAAKTIATPRPVSPANLRIAK